MTTYEKRGCGCNLVILDVIVIILLCIFALPEIVAHEIHLVFKIAIGLMLSVAFFLLLKIKFVGLALNIVIGLLYVLIIYAIVNNSYVENSMGESVGILTNLFNNDPIWWWTIIIIACVLFVGAHLQSSTNLGINSISRKNTNFENFEDEYFENDTFKEPNHEKNQERVQEETAEQNKREEEKNSFSLFAGCNTIEQLKPAK